MSQRARPPPPNVPSVDDASPQPIPRPTTTNNTRPPLRGSRASSLSFSLSPLNDEEGGAGWRAPFQHLEALPDAEALSVRRRDSLRKMQTMSVSPSVQLALQDVLVGLMPRVAPDGAWVMDRRSLVFPLLHLLIQSPPLPLRTQPSPRPSSGRCSSRPR